MKKIVVIIVCAAVCYSNNLLAQTKKATKKSIKKEVKVETKKVVKEDDNAPLTWYTNVFTADSIAKQQKKVIFGFFTGSDWCGWCHKLQRDVFAKPEFIKWAKEKVVLLELDFPRKKQLPQELQQQNMGLAQAFQVQGYPTVWFFNIVKDTNVANIKLNPYGSLGYPSNAVAGKEEVSFLETANEILSKVK